jgi:Fic family protein
MPTYIYEREDWPRFRWGGHALAKALATVRKRQESLLGRMQARGPALRREAVIETLTLEVRKSSEMSGAVLVPEVVRSALTRCLTFAEARSTLSPHSRGSGNPEHELRTKPSPLGPRSCRDERHTEGEGASALFDRATEGIVEVTIDATQRYHRPLTAERLLEWHAALFPIGCIGLHPALVGVWRDDSAGPPQVVSGPADRLRVHFEAPPATGLDNEMQRFLAWFNAPREFDPVLKAGIAHLWFLTLRPFDDGNGRIARAIALMALARAEASPERFYGLSAQLRREHSAYRDLLETTQKGDLDVTPWLLWFLGCLDRSCVGAEEVLTAVLVKARLWEQHLYAAFNERQRDMLNRLLDGFEGNLTSLRWATIERCPPETALHDLDDLVARGILTKRQADGRDTSYALVETLR